jgi:hypothetical protein
MSLSRSFFHDHSHLYLYHIGFCKLHKTWFLDKIKNMTSRDKVINKMPLLRILDSRMHMIMAFSPPSIFARQFKTGLRPVSARRAVAQGFSRITLQARSNFQRSLTTQAASVTRSISLKGGLPFIFTAAGVASVGLGLSAFTRPQIHCDCMCSRNQDTHQILMHYCLHLSSRCPGDIPRVSVASTRINRQPLRALFRHCMWPVRGCIYQKRC